MGDRAAMWVQSQLAARGHQVELVDAAALDLPLLDKMWKEIKHDPPPQYAELHRKLAPLAGLYARADGYVVVCGEYNHSIPPALSNLIDYFLEEYAFRPAAIVCYSAGAFGGVRAAMQLRMLLPETGLVTIPSIQPIPKISTVLNAEGKDPTGTLDKRAGKFFAEFEWYMRAMKTEREKGVPY
jgi:NAD(P)H-dependent FMN reductase